MSNQIEIHRDPDAPEPQQTAPNEERPPWLPEKFSSAEDMAKAYTELERKQSTGEPQTPEQKPDNLSIPEQQQGGALTTDELSDYMGRYAEQGGLTDADYSELESRGLRREMVDAYIEGQEARAAAQEKTVFDMVGGADEYAKIVGWAGANLDDAAKAAFNAAVNSGDAAQVQLAVTGLRAQFQASEGTNPERRVTGDGNPAAADKFDNMHQFVQLTKDPRYSSDPAFRKAAVEKLQRSDI